MKEMSISNLECSCTYFGRVEWTVGLEGCEGWKDKLIGYLIETLEQYTKAGIILSICVCWYVKCTSTVK